jgi:hypothetical protein
LALYRDDVGDEQADLAIGQAYEGSTGKPENLAEFATPGPGSHLA